jgi:hypothetical protein
MRREDMPERAAALAVADVAATLKSYWTFHAKLVLCDNQPSDDVILDSRIV